MVCAHGLCACTVDNPLAKARGLSLRTGAQTMLYLSLVSLTNYSFSLVISSSLVKGTNSTLFLTHLRKYVRNKVDLVSLEPLACEIVVIFTEIRSVTYLHVSYLLF